MDHELEQGDALLGVEAYVVALFGALPKAKHHKRLRQVNYLLKTGRLPGRKVGRFWIGSRRRLQQFIAGEVA
jgi:hypothetical protein